MGAYKPNNAFFEASGSRGVAALEWLVSYIHDVAPEMLVIGDAKRGDTGNTNIQYGRGHFAVTGYDALTISPYLGFGDALDKLVLGYPHKLFLF